MENPHHFSQRSKNPCVLSLSLHLWGCLGPFRAQLTSGKPSALLGLFLPPDSVPLQTSSDRSQPLMMVPVYLCLAQQSAQIPHSNESWVPHPFLQEAGAL